MADGVKVYGQCEHGYGWCCPKNCAQTWPGVTAMAEPADRIKEIENKITPVLCWPLEDRLMLWRMMRMQRDLEHQSSQIRDLDEAIARERKKR